MQILLCVIDIIIYLLEQISQPVNMVRDWQIHGSLHILFRKHLLNKWLKLYYKLENQVLLIQKSQLLFLTYFIIMSQTQFALLCYFVMNQNYYHNQLAYKLKTIKRKQNRMLQILKTSLKSNVSNIFARPTVFCFSTKATDLQTAKLNLSAIVDKQLKEQMKAIPNPKSFQLFFEKEGWKIQRNNAHLQIKRQTVDHQFLMVMTLKPQLQMNAQLKQQQIQSRKHQIQQMKEQLSQNKQLRKYAKQLNQIDVQKEFQENFTQIALFINKKQKNEQLTRNSNKYMCLQYMGNSKIVQLQQIHFLNRLIKNRITRFQSQQIYPGRPLGFISAQKLNQFGMVMVMEWKLTHQHLKNAIQLNWAYQHQQYLNWMRNIKQLL